MPKNRLIVPVGKIEQRIMLIRGEKVIIDADPAEFYGVPTKRLNEQAKRNSDRFPVDFMFQLTTEEKSEVVANCDHLTRLKFSRSLPYAFTEHGTIMAATVLNPPGAIEVSVYIIRVFVRLRQIIWENKELSVQFAQIERQLSDHDEAIRDLVRIINHFIKPDPPPPKRRIGFNHDRK